MSAQARHAVEVQSRDAAARLLQRAAQFVELHAQPLFQKQMRYGARQSVVVRVDVAGVLAVFDPATGQKLAESVQGQIRQLEPSFRPE